MKRNASPPSARVMAWRRLEEWHAGRREQVMDDDDAESKDAGGDPRDMALARELALGSVRWQRLYDALSDTYIKPGEQPLRLRIALRLLCHQFFALDRIPVHAALHETIECAKQCRAGHLSGVINAVGRRLLELMHDDRQCDGPLGKIHPSHWPENPGIRYSLPDALVRDVALILPNGDHTALAALNTVAPLCTRMRQGVTQIAGTSIIRHDGVWHWWDNTHEALRGPVADGRCVVQDRAQGEVLAAARPRPGDWVLDMCAAPGGKACAFVDAGCRVVAADISAVRLKKIRSVLRDTPAVAQDGVQPAFAQGVFDIVVVDAPCSNTGVLGRRPEARWRYDDRHVASLQRIQRSLLAAAAPLVKPGGRLMYSTCSLSPRENQQIAQGLDGWRILSERLTWPDAWQAGGYVAALVRSS